MPITEREFSNLRRARVILLAALNIEEKLDLLMSNYIELETDLLTIAAHDMIWHQLDRGDDEINLVNRRIANLLSSCRLYLDQAPHHINEIAGSDTSIAERFKMAVREKYDQHRSYRVAEALRNYVQHRGFPVHVFHWEGRWVEQGDKKDAASRKRHHSVQPALDQERLREDKVFKRGVLKELMQLPRPVPLMPILREYVEAVGTVHVHLRSATSRLCDEAEAAIATITQKYKDNYMCKKGVGAISATRRDERGNAEVVDLYEELWLRRKFLRRKNSSFANLSQSAIVSDATRCV